MENLSLIESVYGQKPKSSKFTYKQTADNSIGQTYNRIDTFKIQKNRGAIKQFFVKITADLTVVSCMDFFGTNLFRRISLNNNTSVLEESSGDLINSRISLLEGLPLKTSIENGLNQSSISTATDNIVFVPLFFSFSDKNQSLTSSYKNIDNLTITLETQSSAANIGLNGSVNVLRLELITIYEELNNNALYLPLKSGTTLFQEDTITITAGQRYGRVLLKCPGKVINTHFLAVSSNGLVRREIYGVNLEGPNGYLLETEQGFNYALTNTITQDFNDCYSLIFGSHQSNYEDNDYSVYVDSCSPTYATVDLLATYVSDTNVKIISEYKISYENDLINSKTGF